MEFPRALLADWNYLALTCYLICLIGWLLYTSSSSIFRPFDTSVVPVRSPTLFAIVANGSRFGHTAAITGDERQAHISDDGLDDDGGHDDSGTLYAGGADGEDQT